MSRLNERDIPATSAALSSSEDDNFSETSDFVEFNDDSYNSKDDAYVSSDPIL